jgi:hypothetical protein
MPKRIQPARSDTEGLLISCGRRCCICFGLYNDFSVKRGQIAHLDQDPANSDPDNLAFLCLPHHDEYDSVPSVTRRLTIEEVKAYRQALHAAVEELRSSRGQPGPESQPLTEEATVSAESQLQQAEHRRRDLATLRQLLSVLHTALLDDFFEAGIFGIFPIDVAVAHDQFEIVTNASRFHIYDAGLRQHVSDFAETWRACFSYGDYLFPANTVADALQFQSPHMVDNPAEVIEAFKGFQESMIGARAAFRAMISFVLNRYPEIDIARTNKAAWEMLRSTWPDHE